METANPTTLHAACNSNTHSSAFKGETYVFDPTIHQLNCTSLLVPPSYQVWPCTWNLTWTTNRTTTNLMPMQRNSKKCLLVAHPIYRRDAMQCPAQQNIFHLQSLVLAMQQMIKLIEPWHQCLKEKGGTEKRINNAVSGRKPIPPEQQGHFWVMCLEERGQLFLRIYKQKLWCYIYACLNAKESTSASASPTVLTLSGHK